MLGGCLLRGLGGRGGVLCLVCLAAGLACRVLLGCLGLGGAWLEEGGGGVWCAGGGWGGVLGVGLGTGWSVWGARGWPGLAVWVGAGVWGWRGSCSWEVGESVSAVWLGGGGCCLGLLPVVGLGSRAGPVGGLAWLSGSCWLVWSVGVSGGFFSTTPPLLSGGPAGGRSVGGGGCCDRSWPGGRGAALAGEDPGLCVFCLSGAGAVRWGWAWSGGGLGSGSVVCFLVWVLRFFLLLLFLSYRIFLGSVVAGGGGSAAVWMGGSRMTLSGWSASGRAGGGGGGGGERV